MERNPIGAEINPVAFVLTGAKIDCPAATSIKARLRILRTEYDSDRFEAERETLPPFFGRAFHHATLRQILYLRTQSDWKTSRIDRFISALSLGALRGDKEVVVLPQQSDATNHQYQARLLAQVLAGAKPVAGKTRCVQDFKQGDCLPLRNAAATAAWPSVSIGCAHARTSRSGTCR